MCVEGEAGILRALGTSAGEVKEGSSAAVAYAHRSYGEIGLRNGHTIYVDSADDGALRVQGKNLRAIWGDEVGLWTRWETAWNESIRYAVRRGVSRIIATGTPKASRPARRLIRSLIRNEPEHGGVVVTRLRTVDNAANLSDAFLRSVVGAAKGTRLERQELEGELLDDVANALWTRDMIDRVQCPGVGEDGGPPFLLNTVIGVDPSDGAEESDEQAYTVMGMGPPDDHHLYVAENWGGQEAPAPFARRVILKAIQWQAKIIVEKNHGGAWLQTVFAQVMRELDREGLIPEGKPPVQMIHASQAKRTRAEPVSAMYERDGGTLVRHCHTTRMGANGHRLPDEHMVMLEDQQCVFVGAQGERSPDRLDSLCWAATPFLPKSFGPSPPAGVRRWAAAAELADAGQGPDAALELRRRRRLAGQHGGAYDKPQGWDLDDFAPQPDETVANGGRGSAVHSWH